LFELSPLVHLDENTALVEQVMQWDPVAPVGAYFFPASFPHCEGTHFVLFLDLLAVPHRLIVDDTYEGYILPQAAS